MVAPFSSRSLLNLSRFAAVLSGLLFGEGVIFPTSARAQPAQMCGDGTTFTVDLPPVDPATLPTWAEPTDYATIPDAITVPNGCRIYALLVSGFTGNSDLDQFLFYNLAKFVAENDGYVHYAWWNNLLAPYMTRPLHGASHPGEESLEMAFLPDRSDKAIPNEDFQFQSDAEAFLQAIRQNNPDALIVLAGHSMGGGSIARLAANTSVAIDLLAPIDPGGNRSRPVAGIAATSYNWTRWRATHEFLGYKQRDCVKAHPDDFFCYDFDPRFFVIKNHCCVVGGGVCIVGGPEEVGPWFPEVPFPLSLAPLVCPGPWVHEGTRVQFSASVRRLYHRWQKESLPQKDFDVGAAADQVRTFGHPAPRSASILGPNYQAAFGQSDDLPPDPDRTCSIHTRHEVPDPRDSSLICASGDGHGEIVGIRVVCPRDGFLSCTTSLSPLLQFRNHKQPLGIQARFPPKTPGVSTRDCNATPSTWKSSVDKQAAFIELANLGPWPYEPCNPDLDLVSDDLVAIVEDILAQTSPGVDVIPPTSSAAVNPDANENGWHNDDVVVTLQATDDPGGSGVKEIEVSLTGAESGGGVTSGSTAQFPLSNEGTTDVSFFARDNQDNEEAPSNLLTVRIDREPPTLTAILDPEPSERGWIHGDATVTFLAEDQLSGVDAVTPPVTVTTEGANQTVAGTATDRAGNQVSITVTVNIVKTVPDVPTNVVGRSRLLHVNVAWEGSENTLSFVVFRRLDSENDFVEIGQSIFQAFVDDLPTGTLSADYFVVAENDLGPSASSEVVTVAPSLRQRR